MCKAGIFPAFSFYNTGWVIEKIEINLRFIF
jgi:hypothetical protein